MGTTDEELNAEDERRRREVDNDVKWDILKELQSISKSLEDIATSLRREK